MVVSVSADSESALAAFWSCTLPLRVTAVPPELVAPLSRRRGSTYGSDLFADSVLLTFELTLDLPSSARVGSSPEPRWSFPFGRESRCSATMLRDGSVLDSTSVPPGFLLGGSDELLLSEFDALSFTFTLGMAMQVYH